MSNKAWLTLLLLFAFSLISETKAVCPGLDFPLSSANAPSISVSDPSILINSNNTVMIKGKKTQNVFFEEEVIPPSSSRNVVLRKFALFGDKDRKVDLTIKTLSTQYDETTLPTRTVAISRLDDSGLVDCTSAIDVRLVSGSTSFKDLNLNNPIQFSIQSKGSDVVIQITDLILKANTNYQFEFISQFERGGTLSSNESYQVFFGDKAQVDHDAEESSDDSDDDENDNGEELTTDCGGFFMTKGTQPVQQVFQDDNNFFQLSEASPTQANFGSTINISAGLDQVRGKLTEIYARNSGEYPSNKKRRPGRLVINKHFSKITFTYTTKYSKQADAEFNLVAEDSEGVVLSSYKKTGLKVFSEPPCLEDEQTHELVIKLPLTNKKPEPKAFTPTNLGTGTIKSTVSKNSDNGAFMQTITSFNIVNTQIGKIAFIPIIRTDLRRILFEPKNLANKFKKDIDKLKVDLEERLPDIYPLAPNKISSVSWDVRRKSISGLGKVPVIGVLESMAVRNFISAGLKLSNTFADESKRADILVGIIDDRDGFKALVGGKAKGAATRDFVDAGSSLNGVIYIPGKAASQSRSNWSKHEVIILAHEISHKLGFHAEKSAFLDTSCPPTIHNVSRPNNFLADGCDLTFRGTQLKGPNRCYFDKSNIMSDGIPRSRITQCTYYNLLTRMTSENTESESQNLLANTNDTSSLQVSFYVNIDDVNGNSAAFLPIIDTSLPQSSEEEKHDGDWTLVLKDSSGAILNSYYFNPNEEDFTLGAPYQFIYDFNIPISSDLSEISILDENEVVVKAKSFSNIIPSLSSLNLNQDSDGIYSVSWQASSSVGELSYTLLAKSSSGEVSLVPGALHITETQYEFNSGFIPEDTESIMIVVSNGFRSTTGDFPL